MKLANIYYLVVRLHKIFASGFWMDHYWISCSTLDSLSSVWRELFIDSAQKWTENYAMGTKYEKWKYLSKFWKMTELKQLNFIEFMIWQMIQWTVSWGYNDICDEIINHLMNMWFKTNFYLFFLCFISIIYLTFIQKKSGTYERTENSCSILYGTSIIVHAKKTEISQYCSTHRRTQRVALDAKKCYTIENCKIKEFIVILLPIGIIANRNQLFSAGKQKNKTTYQ